MSKTEKPKPDILLIGQPNVGKSVLFSRLTGIKTIASNYPGTTVSYAFGKMGLGPKKFSLVDAPGTYSLDPLDEAAKVAVDLIDQTKWIVNVIDATHLERNLPLTMELIAQGKPVVVALNMSDEAKHRGIQIDIPMLQKELGVPVVETVARTGQGANRLIAALMKLPEPSARQNHDDHSHPGHHPHIPKPGFESDGHDHVHLDRAETWKKVGEICARVQTLRHHHHTIGEFLEDISVHPIWGAAFAFLALAISFSLVRLIGEFLITGGIGIWGDPWIQIPFGTEWLFETFWKPPMTALSNLLGEDSFLSKMLIGALVNGEIDFMQSFGLLTSGLFIPIGAVLPYIIAFYFVVAIMEDTGYLPRLAVFLDNIMHKFGLHGFAIIPTMLGLGCNVPGIMATRILESRRQRLITATLISIAIPCAALQAMIIGFVGSYGAWPVVLIYTALFLNWIALGFVLKFVSKGFAPELLIEIPPYRMPAWKALWSKMKSRTWGFLKEAVPIVMASILVVNLLYVFGVFEFIADAFSPLVTKLWGLPKEAIVPLFIGILRKDVAVGMFAPLDLTIKQLVTGAVVLAMFFPCLATFSVMMKEFGVKDTLKATAIMLTATIITGTLINWLWI